MATQTSSYLELLFFGPAHSAELFCGDGHHVIETAVILSEENGRRPFRIEQSEARQSAERFNHV